MRVTLNHFCLDRYHCTENPKSHNTDLSITGKGAREPSGRFIPPQPNSTDNSSQNTDSSNTTTVYYEKSTGGCQNKMTTIQMSPRDPGPIGTTTATQMTNKATSQAGGTQTTPPPSPKKSTSTGATQIYPPTGNPCQQVGQGQPDCNQDKEGQVTEIHHTK